MEFTFEIRSLLGGNNGISRKNGAVRAFGKKCNKRFRGFYDCAMRGCEAGDGGGSRAAHNVPRGVGTRGDGARDRALRDGARGLSELVAAGTCMRGGGEGRARGCALARARKVHRSNAEVPRVEGGGAWPGPARPGPAAAYPALGCPAWSEARVKGLEPGSVSGPARQDSDACH